VRKGRRGSREVSLSFALNIYRFPKSKVWSRDSKLIETNYADAGSMVVHMKEILRKPVLNPAFKRFQYLPHLPIGGASKRACAAPQAGESRRASHQSEAIDPQCDRISKPGTCGVTEQRPSNWEFQSPA
jgi:hypothetical protein